MFLHIGEDVVVPLKEILSIIDLTKGDSAVNREFLKTAEEEGFVVQLTGEPVSLVVCGKRIYLSPISAQTLFKRAQRGIGDLD